MPAGRNLRARTTGVGHGKPGGLSIPVEEAAHALPPPAQRGSRCRDLALPGQLGGKEAAHLAHQVDFALLGEIDRPLDPISLEVAFDDLGAAVSDVLRDVRDVAVHLLHSTILAVQSMRTAFGQPLTTA